MLWQFFPGKISYIFYKNSTQRPIH